MDSQKKIPVMTSDGVRFEIDADVAMKMGTLKSLIEKDATSSNSEPSVIPLPNVSSESLEKVVDYIKMELELNVNTDESLLNLITKTMYLAKLDYDSLMKLILGAKNLNMKELLDLSEESFIISGKKFKNGYTPEEKEAENRAEYLHLFD